MAEFRINISKLSEGIHDYHFEGDPSKMGLDERFIGTIKVDARIDKNVRQILLKVDIKAGGSFFCDRCLDNFSKELNTSYSMVYIQGARSTAEMKNEEDIQVLAPDMNYVDLDEDVRQYVLLTVPQKLLCKEECQGFCPTCGVNKNVAACTCSEEVTDSRWDALKKLSHN